MTTAFSAITGAFLVALSSAPAVSASIYRARDRELPEARGDAVNVVFEAAEPAPGAIAGAPVDWRTRIAVECYCRTSASSADLAMDPLLEKIFARLAADMTLGGLVDDIGYPAIEADYDSQGQKTGWMRLTYTVQHRTSNLTLN